jgi:hypothetical protein
MFEPLRPDVTPRGRKPLVVAALSAGWLLIAAATAGAVVAVGHASDGASQSAATGSGTTPSGVASASGTPSPTPTPTPSAPSSTATTPAVPPTTPKPVSTVTGKVTSDLLHSGDLRFFLLPVPSDAGVIGAADGKPLTKDDVAHEYVNSADVLKSLNLLGFKDGAYRDYQTGDAKYHVVARLLHFSSAQSAKLWFQGDKPDPLAKAFPVNGFPDAKGYYLPPLAHGDVADLRGLYYTGDVVFEIVVVGQDPIDKNILAGRIHKQVDRLTTGG